MIPQLKFIKLTKGEQKNSKRQTNSHKWIITEKKFLALREVFTLRKFGWYEKNIGLQMKNFKKVRNWFMVELGLNTGLRVDEMAHLQHKDLLIDEDRSTIVVLGKGKKLRSIKISLEFKTTCFEYLAYKNQFGYSVDSESSLLNTRIGNRISKRSLQKSFKEIIEKSGLPKRYSIHCLRHTYITHILKASNNNYRLAQIQAGHSSIKTTQTYAGVLDEDLEKAVEQMYILEENPTIEISHISGG